MNGTLLRISAFANDTVGQSVLTHKDVTITINNTRKYDVWLTKAWNRIVLPPMSLSNNTTTSVFSSLSGAYNSIWWYQNASLDGAHWFAYTPGDPGADLTSVGTGESYWLNMK